MAGERLNVADRLTAASAIEPGRAAVISRVGGEHRHMTFGALEADASALARGLIEMGVQPGTRLVLLVPPSPEFVALVFALLRSGATTVLVDPGMGRKHLVNCLAAAEPEGFVAVSRAQAVRAVLRRRFSSAKFNVTIGRRWFWGGVTYDKLLQRGRGSSATLPTTQADDPAAIIFTSGSTGPPKGVLYTQRMFDTQVAEIQRTYDIQPGGIDMACFAPFGLFNAAMGVTTVFPNMDFSRPASADPVELLRAGEWATQAFASPTIWDKLSRYCEETGGRMVELRKVFSCGAPVGADVVKRTLQYVCMPGQAEMHTPYGATEALPVSTIEAKEILGETAARSSKGAGVCVGRKFDSVEWKVIRIMDGAIRSIERAEELPIGEIGELMVRGPQVSPEYVTGEGEILYGKVRGISQNIVAWQDAPELAPGVPNPIQSNLLAKIRDGDTVWHRMGDVGYLDVHGRFWYCGRKSHRVESRGSSVFSVPAEEIFNSHPRVKRSAVVGRANANAEEPVLIVELVDGDAARGALRADDELVADLRALRDGYAETHESLRLVNLDQVLVHPHFPVDVRHNAKINREELGAWATEQLKDLPES